MKKIKNLVWTAVFAVVLGVLSVLTAIFSLGEISISLGFCAVVSAILASRESL